MNTIKVSNGLDPGQDRCSVHPDLFSKMVPNCVERYQQKTKVAASKGRVKYCLSVNRPLIFIIYTYKSN